MKSLAKIKVSLVHVAVPIILFGLFLRLYRLPETMIFQADQGRDAMVVEQILDGDIQLIGPGTSVGNMYLGPFYYYFMAPFLALTSPSPVGPAYGVALLNSLLVILFYFWIRRRFDDLVAIFALIFLSLNAVAVSLSRFSWNPNISPFFAFITYLLCAEALLRKDYRWLILASLSFGILTQSHYMTLLMGGVLVITVIWAWVFDSKHRPALLKHSLASILVYLATWLPLIIFDLRHNHLILQGFAQYFSDQREKLPFMQKLITSFKESEGRSFRILAQLNQSPNGIVDRLVSYGSGLILAVLLLTKKLSLKTQPEVFLLIGWLCFGIAGTAIYPDSIYDHYLAFLIPGVALFFAVLLRRVWDIGFLAKGIVIVILTLYALANLAVSPAFQPGGPAYWRFATASQFVLDAIPEGSYNIALLSENKDWRGLNYRYFLSQSHHPPEDVETYQNLTTLVIIDELRVDDPLAYGIYEIQVPGLTSINQIIEVPQGPRLYILN